MALTTTQKELIVLMDKDAKRTVKQGGDGAILMSLAHKMHQIKDIMNSSSEGELNFYCQRYEGFYQYMKLLEKLAVASSQGAFNDIIN